MLPASGRHYQTVRSACAGSESPTPLGIGRCQPWLAPSVRSRCCLHCADQGRHPPERFAYGVACGSAGRWPADAHHGIVRLPASGRHYQTIRSACGGSESPTPLGIGRCQPWLAPSVRSRCCLHCADQGRHPPERFAYGVACGSAGRWPADAHHGIVRLPASGRHYQTIRSACGGSESPTPPEFGGCRPWSVQPVRSRCCRHCADQGRTHQSDSRMASHLVVPAAGRQMPTRES